MKRCKSAIASLSHRDTSTASTTTYNTEEPGGGLGELELEPTALFLSSSPSGVDDERLHLPRRGTAPCSLDVYLKSIPSVAERAEELLQGCPLEKATALKTAASSQKCLTVLQGEVAHASEAQTDLLVSGEATTCHVVALRSTHSKSQSALASMAHVDQEDVYEECLEKIIQEHLQHHLQQKGMVVENAADDYGFYMGDEEESLGGEEDCAFGGDEEEEEEDQQEAYQCTTNSFLPQPDFSTSRPRSQSTPTLQSEPIEMELHIAGGYTDEEGTSQGLSTSLVHSFSKLADEYQGKIRLSLSTAAISSMNTSDDSRPRSRGLAINTHTGEVTAVTTSLPSELEGPAMEVRSARVLCPQRRNHPELAVIHKASSDGNITIDPFQYQAQPQLDALLKVPDPVLLKYTSTSPECESERFCSDLRRTLSFVNTVSSNQVFEGGQRPLVYSRSSNALNQWEPVVAGTAAAAAAVSN